MDVGDQQVLEVVKLQQSILVLLHMQGLAS